MRRLFYLSYLIIGCMMGCTSYDSPFVSKSEAELDAMELTNEAASTHFYTQSYAKADQLLTSISHEQTVSTPQYMLERASLLLMLGKHDEAHALMMDAREHIETLFDPASEEKAVSFWHGENNKVFKGDNHERATLYALLALSFIEKGEWEDAQRCVKNGLLADISAEEDNYNSDYALLHYLGYVAAKKMNQTEAAADYKREFIQSMRARGYPADEAETSYAKLFDETDSANTLMVLWTGRAPMFLRGGEYEELRMVVPGENPYTLMTAEVDNNGTEKTFAKAVGDVNFQATTRGGRAMDNVLQNKAALKKGMEVSRNIFMAAAAGCLIAATQQNDPNTALVLIGISGGCFVAGVIPWVIGASINSTADVRYWHNLPGEFLIMPLQLPEGQHSVAIRAYQQYDAFAYEEIQFNVGATPLAVHHIPFIQDRLLPGDNPTTALNFFQAYSRGCQIIAERLRVKITNWTKDELEQ